MKIALIYNKTGEATTGVYIEKVIKNSGHKFEHFWTEYSSEIPKDFDLYFRIDHGDYKYDIPHDLHPAIFYAIDTHLKKPFKKMKRQVDHYDIVFCAQKTGAKKLRKIKVDAVWVPLGCDPEIHKRVDTAKIYDIGFVGRDAQKFDRGRHLKLLNEKYPKSFIGASDFKKMGGIYSASKIGFNSSIINDINMRVFEVMASGCFLLTNHIKNNGLEELFINKEHLITYKNDKEMIEFVNYYLNNEKERKSIAAKGYETVTNEHTYYHRVQAMFNYIAFK
ncbi:MAG: glycosyltransferase, partial [Candidatus Omnitrophica bacterium]|nr:glycosyltransferase [Candidatus Omnitrophota bacterium]